jgi:hypothetical protein
MKEEPDLFAIDPHRLPEEWIAQPRFYRQYADRLADARKDVEEAKAALDLADAELDRDIRSDPRVFCPDLEPGKKPTETAIANAKIISTRHQRANTRCIDAKHKADVLGGWLTALDHRKKALEKLVDLHLADLRAEPRESQFARDNREQATDKAFGKKKRA